MKRRISVLNIDSSAAPQMTDFGVWQQAPAFGFQLCIIKEEVMAKNTIWFVVIMVVGALLGSFLGKFIGIVVPAGSIRDLFSTDIRRACADDS